MRSTLKKKTLALYHPNMHHMGGGETVALTIASALRKEYNITIFISRKVDVHRLEKFYGLPLDGVRFRRFAKALTSLPTLQSFKASLYLRYASRFLKNFDLVIDTCSNGLFYKKLNTKTICYIHFPNYTKPKRGWKSFFNRFLIQKKDMFHYDKVLCNSAFTQSQVAKLTNHPTAVVHPPVKVDKVSPAKKKNTIISIGRYSPEKKFQALVEAFIKIEKDLPEYTLHLIGAYTPESDQSYMAMLKRMAEGHRVVFHRNVNHPRVLKYLESAKIYWHARGFGESDPVQYENFGITTVEAMAAGCIPIVINLGAQPEIITHDRTGYCWNTIDELALYTKKSLSSAKTKLMIARARADAKRYSLDIFVKKIRTELKKLD